jgi:hypothetical protein
MSFLSNRMLFNIYMWFFSSVGTRHAFLSRSRRAGCLTFTRVPLAEEDPASKVAKVEVPTIRPPIMPNHPLGMAFPPRPYGVPRPMYTFFILPLPFSVGIYPSIA